jgi:predicted aldo/keto reductase-like oxidoreductase
MTENELALVERVKEKYEQLGYIRCSGCGYCMPCPKGVNIPTIFSLYHDYRMIWMPKNIKSKYWEHITPRSQSRRCMGCGRCEDLCPQKMAVRSVLSEAELVCESGYSQISYYPKRGLRLMRNELRKVLSQAKSKTQSED